MKRREFIVLLGGAAAAWPLSASGQPTSRTVKVGILTSGNQFTSPAIASFRREMGNLGYVEGGNLTIEFRTAPGEPQRIVSQAAELVGMPVDVIVTDGTPAALAAKQATSNIPIVMAVIGVDPVQSGLVTSFARPGGNITGFPILAPELGTKRLEILKEAVPGLKRVGVLWNSTNPTNSTPQLAALAEAAGALGIEIQAVPVQNRDGFAPAFDELKALQVSAVTTLADAMMFGERQQVVELAIAARLPGMFSERPYAEAGGLLSYGPDIFDCFKRAAGYVDRILKGEKPANLPVQFPTKFELVINLKTAKAIGHEVPAGLVLRADTVIE
jgi:putative tryptophan/tyrosine transport system substrate-binding protein